MENQKLLEFNKNLKKNILYMAKIGGASSAHIGGALSLTEIFSVLFSNFIDIREDLEKGNKFILSKGHACLALYCVLFETKIISENELNEFEKDGSDLLGHPVKNKNLKIPFSTGSLGMGLGLGIGMAIGIKKKQSNKKVYVVLGDGECNEGSVWESIMLAPKYKLSNLTAIIDKNGYQQTGSTETILKNDNLEEKIKSFGWNTISIDGHSIDEIKLALKKNFNNDKPIMIIAKTIKGKGIPEFENDNKWHHATLTEEIYLRSLAKLNEI